MGFTLYGSKMMNFSIINNSFEMSNCIYRDWVQQILQNLVVVKGKTMPLPNQKLCSTLHYIVLYLSTQYISVTLYLYAQNDKQGTPVVPLRRFLLTVWMIQFQIKILFLLFYVAWLKKAVPDEFPPSRNAPVNGYSEWVKC